MGNDTTCLALARELWGDDSGRGLLEFLDGTLVPESLRGHPDIALLSELKDAELATCTQKFYVPPGSPVSNYRSLKEKGACCRFLGALARVGDRLIQRGHFPYFLTPGDIFIVEEKIFFRWPRFRDMCAWEPRSLNTRAFEHDMFLLPPALRRGKVNQESLTPWLSVHAYCALYVKLLLPPLKLSLPDWNQAVKSLNVYNPDIPPETCDYLYSLLYSRDPGSPPPSLQEVHERVSSLADQNMFTPVDYRALEMEVSHYSQQGIKKTRQEDFVFSLKARTSCLLITADGVSKATVGSGWKATTLLADYVFENEEKLGKQLEEISTLCNHDRKWRESARDCISQVFHRFQDAVMKEIRNRMSGRKLSPGQHFMSSTMTVALLSGTRGLVGWMGDSPAMLFRAGRLYDITEPHNQDREALRQKAGTDTYPGGWQDNAGSENRKALSRSIPMLSTEEGKIEDLEIDEYIEYRDFFLKEGDLLILSTDGLVDCVEGQTGDEQRANLSSHVEQVLRETTNINRCAAELTWKPVMMSGHDNISASVAYYIKKEVDR